MSARRAALLLGVAAFVTVGVPATAASARHAGGTPRRGCRPAATVSGCGAPVPTISLGGSPRVRASNGQTTIDLPYRGFSWDPQGGPIDLSFDGEDAGRISPTDSFGGSLKISHWPQRTDVDGALKSSGGGYCWGTLKARQGSKTATTGKIQGNWAGWVLWSADPAIKSKEAWCEGEDETFLSRSSQPIIAFGTFATVGGRLNAGFKVFNLDGPSQNSPVYKIAAGHSLTVNVTRSHVCVKVSIDQRQRLTTSVTHGSCPKDRPALARAAAARPKPKAGAWKFGEADGGFNLVAGKGKDRGRLFLTNVHSTTQNFVGCPDDPERITVSGRLPLKTVRLDGGYEVWAVGKPGSETRYSDGNTGLISIPAAVKVNGQPVPGGAIKMEFSAEHPTEFSILVIEFGSEDRGAPCVTYSESASHS